MQQWAAWEVVACLEAWVGVCLGVWVEAEGAEADVAKASSSK